MKPSRRAFFLPRVLATSSWGQFCHRLTRAIAGHLDDDTPAPDSPGRARLTLARDEDVYHARALCAEFGVLLVPAGVAPETLPATRSWLQLDSSRLDALDSFNPMVGIITLQGGCRIGAVRERLAGSNWCWDGGDDDQTIEEWLANASGWLPGRCGDSGLVSADVMLAEGNFERLGPFGADSTRPLGSGASGRLVAGLFQLSTGPDAVSMMAEAAWPARYRLDALSPVARPGQPELPVNPAHFLLGSGGTLAWPARLRLQARSAGVQPAVRTAPDRAERESQREMPSDRTDAMVKALFDPIGIFPS